LQFLEKPRSKRGWGRGFNTTNQRTITLHPTIAIVANSAWNLHNFRRGLIRASLAAGHRVILVAPDGPERAELEKTGGFFVPLRNLRRRGLNPLRDLALARELYGVYRQHQVAVALHFTIKPVVFGSFAARRVGVHNISTLTGLGYAFISGGATTSLASTLYRLALKSAAKVFFHNPDDRRLFLKNGLVTASQSAVVGGSGLRLEDYPLAPYTEAIAGRFLFVGRLLVDKGIREFVAAAKLAKVENPGLSFHVLGPLDSGNPAGINSAELDAWVAEGVIAYDGVTKDIRPHLRRASVVVLPSYREGCPRVLLEAAATGRALIGTDVPGVREVVTPENGWRVPLKNGDALKEAMLGTYGKGVDLAALGQAGRELVQERFTEEKVVADYLRAIGKMFA